jgi:ABC-type multidrug transport system permease subunit
MSTVANAWSSYRRRAPSAGSIGAVIRRDLAVERSYRLAFVLDAFYGLFELVVYYFISRTFAGVPSEDLQGAPSYFAFAAVGAVLGAVIYSAATSIGQRLRREQLTGTLEALVAQPVTPAEICIGLTGFSFLFAWVRALVYLVVATVLMHLDVSETSWIGLILVLLVAGPALAAFGILAGAAVLVLKRGEYLAGATLFVMTFLSGSVFPIAALPAWLQAIGEILPMRFAFDGARAALFTGEGWGADVVVLAVYGAVGIPLAVLVFARALMRAKAAGSLSQY